ncbi:MAG: ATP-binding cassette domain-containing protein [Candidatus Limivivens sp.]|nr:ATP-binding cassette domain-containing protein [Candidatus Limivivens sp.]
MSFQLHRGEILGFAGLVGAGRTETMRAIFGADPWKEGEIILDGKSVHFKSPKAAIRGGIGLATEDRKDQGIFAIRSVMDNINVASMEKVSKGQWLIPALERKTALQGIEDFHIKTPDEEKHIGELSGGNQQKVILARWLAADPKVLILDEPTKGIDVGAKAEIYQMACDLAKKGIGVIIISSELPEIIGLSDRILVMHNGRITGELNPKTTTEAEILSYAMKET